MKVISSALNSTYNKERLYKIILGPHISEKVSVLGDDKNQYAFKIFKDATKGEVKKAVEELFQVTVTDVCVLNVKGKVKRTARGFNRKKNWKKAYVSVQEGQEIDYMVVE